MGTEVLVKVQNTVLLQRESNLLATYTVSSARTSLKQELVILQSVLFSTPRTNFLLKVGKIAV